MLTPVYAAAQVFVGLIGIGFGIGVPFGRVIVFTRGNSTTRRQFLYVTAMLLKLTNPEAQLCLRRDRILLFLEKMSNSRFLRVVLK